MENTEFDRLMRCYERLVFTICRQLVRDYHEAQNLTQETFLSVYEHMDRDRPENEKAWIARIATNKAKDYLKSAYFRRMGVSENIDDIELKSPIAGPEEHFIQESQARQIREMILDLQEPYHKASILFFLEEKSVREIAEILQRPEKTIRTQLGRAKEMLRNKRLQIEPDGSSKIHTRGENP